MPRSLFRKEAIDAQREKFLGEASIAQPVRLWVYTAVALTIAALVVGYAIWGQYTRRERVQGYLASAVGAALVRLPDAGVVSDVMVREGDVVAAGAPLARLSVDKSGVNDATGNEAVLRELEARRGILGDERAQAEKLGAQQVEQLRRRVGNLQEEIRQADTQIRLQEERLAQSRQLLAKWEDVAAKDRYTTEFYLLRYRNEAKDEEIKVQSLQRQRAALMKDLAQARSDIPSAELRAKSDVERIARQESEIGQSIVEQGVRREQSVKRDMIVAAPIAGTVTNIAPARGQAVPADAPFATLLPKDSALHAELLVPTRAIGFVHPGQRVMLRYEAFPYERFGQYEGKVLSIGKTIWSAGEAVGPLAAREPVYRIVVAVDRQDIRTGGDTFPLRAGMVLSADLLMERRSIAEWLFQPVLQLRERVNS